MLPHHPQPRRYTGRGDAAAGGAATHITTNALVRAQVQWSSRRAKKLGLDFAGQRGRQWRMDDASPLDPELIDLVVRLCTRVGMIMEDCSPMALNASREDLHDRVSVIVSDVRTMGSIAEAVQRLLGQ